MHYIHIIFAALLTQTIVAISPGPDFAIVMRNAMLHSRKAALQTAVGVALGIGVHATYCVFLLSYLLEQAWLVIALVKYLGALYLIYLAIKSLLAAVKLWQVHYRQQEPLLKLNHQTRGFLWSGFLCNLLNPKAILFFISLFSVIISSGAPLSIRIICALGMVATTLIWFSLLSWLITHAKFRHVFTSHQFQAWVNLGTGIIFLLFASLLLLVKIHF